MRTFVCFPPLSRMTGGMAVLLRLAAHLHAAGYPVWLTPREPLADGVLPEGCQDLPVCAWDQAAPGPDDIWLAPEGWPGLLLPGLQARARVTLYVQNWAYLLSSLPVRPGMTMKLGSLPIHYIAVSRPVAAHIFYCLGMHNADGTPRKIPVLRPGIDQDLFHPLMDKDKLAPFPGKGSDRARIAWMPRKNKALASQIHDMLTARVGTTLEWIEIHHRTQAEVAHILRTSDLFLASGFPEGCPLPPLEAMASGCPVAGFPGFGGLDYMRQGWEGGEAPFPAGGLYPIFCDEDPIAIHAAGNGFWAHDADTIGATMAVEYALHLLAKAPEQVDAVRRAGLATAGHYNLASQRTAVLALWADAAAGIALPALLR